jgi:GT2 family glycosyltransferase
VVKSAHISDIFANDALRRQLVGWRDRMLAKTRRQGGPGVRTTAEDHDGNEIPLSIVIPTFNQCELLCRCIASVVRHAPAHTEIIVVDDGSSDQTARMAWREWPGVRLIQRTRNGGFCRAANTGISAARGGIVELLNNDAEVTEGWAEAALEAFTDPSVGSVAPLVRRLPHRRNIDSAGDIFQFHGIARKRGEGRSWKEPRWRVSTEVNSASASSAFYRRSALQAVGGFPESFGAYLDDVDLGLRLRLAGFRCLYIPQSVVFHWVGQSHRTSSRRMQQQVSANSERVFWANLSRGQLVQRALPHLGYVLTLLAYKALKSDFSPWFAGKCQALAQIPSLLRARSAAQALSESSG